MITPTPDFKKLSTVATMYDVYEVDMKFVVLVEKPSTDAPDKARQAVAGVVSYVQASANRGDAGITDLVENIIKVTQV